MVGLRNSVVGMCESLADDATTALPPSVCSALLAVADDSNRFMLVVSMLAVITFVAVTCTDIGVIVGVSGALLGALIVYIVPPLLYKGARDDAPGDPGARAARRLPRRARRLLFAQVGFLPQAFSCIRFLNATHDQTAGVVVRVKVHRARHRRCRGGSAGGGRGGGFGGGRRPGGSGGGGPFGRGRRSSAGSERARRRRSQLLWRARTAAASPADLGWETQHLMLALEEPPARGFSARGRVACAALRGGGRPWADSGRDGGAGPVSP